MRSISLYRSLLLLCCILIATFPLVASDHGDSPNNADDRGTDLADGYMFLDPNDNSRVVMILTFSGFIVPGENANFALFGEDGTVRFTFDIENTGDAVPDLSFRVTFGPKQGPAGPQTATIELPDGRTFTAPSTVSSNTAETAPEPVITTDSASGVSFFAGLTDDPFFFDIPAFGRFVASVRAGSPNAAVLQRGRDSFAGYNVMAIALSVPASLLRGSAGNVIGMSNTSQRRIVQFIGADGRITGSGRYVNADRQGLPAINTVTIPFARKKEYNHATPQDDAAGRFAGDIVATLQSLGTNSTNIGILADLVVTRGDILRVDTSIANTGSGGGTNTGAGFPNGRRLADDVIDTLLFFVANQNTLGDNVDANDVAFRDTFPFLAPAHQPLAPGAVDNTRN
ncbi:MAG TPA: DUF4331 family protein [Thermoanaerobaculia bacterium]|nr:DUF4331 family protein [Thermoanaerobaculia bacterium]